MNPLKSIVFGVILGLVFAMPFVNRVDARDYENEIEVLKRIEYILEDILDSQNDLKGQIEIIIDKMDSLKERV